MTRLVDTVLDDEDYGDAFASTAPDPCPYCASPSCRHPEVCGAELDQPEEGA